MHRRRTRWFRRLAAGLAFATLAAPAAAKIDEGGNAAATPQVISYLSHGMTSADVAAAPQVISYLSHGMTAADVTSVGNGDALTHRQLETLAASQPVGNYDAMTHRQLEELAAANATRFVPGVTDFPRPVAVAEPEVINYLSQGMTADDAAALATGSDRQFSPSIQGELVKSHEPATIRPDDRSDRFALSDVGSPVTAGSDGASVSWDGALTVGIGTLVLFLALGLGFGYIRRPRIAGL